MRVVFMSYFSVYERYIASRLAARFDDCRLVRLLADTAPEVRAMAVWALSRLGRLENVREILSEETDDSVVSELDRAETTQ